MLIFLRVLWYYVEHFYISHTLAFLFGLPRSRLLRVGLLSVIVLRSFGLALDVVDGRACCRWLMKKSIYIGCN
ncbi:hypothetical protein RHMOL_Rhmol10G0146300 [Rhododendron molle]|uniref:Uncharacterized protein n=1 Tax=Rhododendron molle TaxID=49168 RepID=A0ACC0M3A2_RHOML|nr:hypothetical protein RHMOL_Rhmol10G0146300 [Rhododendron molle]